MPPAEPAALPLRHAVALGLLQGPTELLPISSSAHTTLLPWSRDWPYYADANRELRKTFELALHAGAGVALLRDARRLTGGRWPSPGTLAAGLAPVALAGLVLRKAVERWLGGPRSIAAGLVGGAVAMGLAERAAGRRQRSASGAGPRDGFVLGLAQTAALAPGVSRNGATLAAARARGFDRRSAHSLSWGVGLPILLGASAAESPRVIAGNAPRGVRRALAGGATAAFVSTTLSARMLGPRLPELRLTGFAAYRVLLAGLVLRRMGRAK
jgi:undecaprenyl-diphosphatase